MASANNDVEEHIDDVISKLDLTKMKSDVDLETYGERKTGNEREESKHSTDSESPTKKSGSFVDNFKKQLPTKGPDSCTNSANTDGVPKSNSSISQSKDGQRMPKSSDRYKALKDVKVDNLPQGFVCKYVGSKPCSGLWGVRHTRQPVDQMVTELRKLPEGDDLPLVNVKVSKEGLKASLHMHNTSSRSLSDAGLLPLQFISYAVQDPRYTRIFVFILVREMSSRDRKTECHAYLCSSDIVARKMALSVALAFGEFSKKLDGKAHRFHVDLRDTDELETELISKSSGGSTEYEA